MIELKLKAYPPSANQLYRKDINGDLMLFEKHKILSYKYKMYRNMVFVASRFKEKITKYPVDIEILVMANDNRKIDKKNIAEVVLSSLVNAKVLEDDSNKQINSIRIANIGFLCDGVGETTIKIKSIDNEL